MMPYNDHKMTSHGIAISGYYASLQKDTQFCMHDNFINDSYFKGSYKPDTKGQICPHYKENRRTTSRCAVPELVHKLSPFHWKAAIAGRDRNRRCFVNAIGPADAQRCTFKYVHGCLNDSGAGQRQNMQQESFALFFPVITYCGKAALRAG